MKKRGGWHRAVLFGVAAALAATTLGGCLWFPRRSTGASGSGSPGSIAGSVVDERGQPLAGALVTIPEASQLTAVTGVDGRFTLAGLAPGAYNVRVSKENYLSGAYGVTVAPAGSVDLAVQLLDTSGHLHNDSRRVPNLCRDCHALHNPTSSNYALDAVSANDLCYRSGCHTQVALPSYAVYRDSPHGPAWVPAANSPFRFAWPGQPDSDRGNCATCHEPHGITGPPKMLRLGQSNRNDLCFTCHSTAGTGGYTAGWPGQGAYTSANNLHANPGASATPLKVYPGTGYRAGECVNCHEVHGRTYAGYGGNYPYMTRNYGYALCVTCHTDKAPKVNANTGHGQCTLCHDPHRAERGKVKNPANPNGPLLAVPKSGYRGQTMIDNAYCETCHRATPPAGYEAAKDPYTETQFTNAQATPDRSLHRVHVQKIRGDFPWQADRSYDHPEYPYRGQINNARCVMCHTVHPNQPQSFNLRGDAIISRTKTGGAYNGKSGCSTGLGCHTCNYCHANPGGPGVDCTCSHSDPGYHGIVY